MTPGWYKFRGEGGRRLHYFPEPRESDARALCGKSSSREESEINHRSYRENPRHLRCKKCEGKK